jgi:hypothetical protein
MRIRCPACGKITMLPESESGQGVICVACGERYEAPRSFSTTSSTPTQAQGVTPLAQVDPREKKPVLVLTAWAAVGIGLLLTLVIWSIASIQSAPPTAPAHAKPVAKAPARNGEAKHSEPTSRIATAVLTMLPAQHAGPAGTQQSQSVVTSSFSSSIVMPSEPMVITSSPPKAIAPANIIPRSPATRRSMETDDLSDAQIGEAIRKGVDFLLGQFSASTGLLRELNTDPYSLTTGEDVLCVYALLQASQAIDDSRLNPKEPRMKELIAAMKQLPLQQYYRETYARALRVSALTVYDRPEDRQALAADTLALTRGARAGAYTYRVSPYRGVGRFTGAWDNSNSQYGLLGVWSGAEVGREVPTTYWQAVSKHWEDTQSADGEWSYHGPSRVGTHSMTCAGLASLFVAHDYLEPARFTGSVGREPFIPAIVRGLKWLEADANSITLDHAGYDLYGVERVGLASGFKYLGSHDWYRELAIETIKRQRADGAFEADSVAYGARVETAYSLLFLARGRHPILMNKLRFEGHWANRPRDVANLARFASHQLERPLNWQVVPISRDWTEWMDSPILYLASHEAPRLSDEDYGRIRQFVENGGLLFTQADGDSPEFNRFAEELAKRLFGAYPMSDLPANHPMYSTMFRLPSVPGLRAVSNGSRLLMLHSTTDLARYWELRDFKSKAEMFQWGTNLFLYAAGKRDLRNRLVSTYIPSPTAAPSQTFRVARLQYDGNWNPEPAAWGRFSRWFAGETSYGLEIKDVPIAELKPGTAPVAALTGTSRHDLNDAEATAIKSYVEAGGVLLVDMCGGSGDFDAGLESSLYLKAFADTLARTVIGSHSLLSGDRNGMDDLSRTRLRTFAVEALGSGGGALQELAAGRGHIITTRLDITTGLLGTQTWGIRGYDPDYAQRLVKNVILWALDGQRD